MAFDTRSVQDLAGRPLFAAGLGRWLAPERLVILAFHRVNDAMRDGLTCGVADFDRYCAFLARHYDVLSLGELLSRRDAGTLPRRPLAITFDDGYQDNWRLAAPVLQKHGLPATFFISTGFIGTQRVAPWDRDITPPPAWMSWEEVRAMHAAGFEIGAHTVNHPDLGTLEPERTREELTESRARLEAELGVDIDLFAYPFGGERNLSEANRAVVRELGFRCCVSCHGGTNALDADAFHLQRVPVSDWYVSPHHLGLSLLTGRA